MSRENVELVREALRAFQAGDPGWADTMHPEIAWDISAHPLPDVPNVGRGRENFLNQVIATYTGGWRGYRSELREAIDAGDDVVVVLHETAHLRDSDAVLDRDLVHVWTMRGGRSVLFRVFRSKAAALEAVGLPE